MWFKRALLGSCAASVAVTVVSAAHSEDAIVLKRHHQVEGLIFPSLERRQRPAANQTSVTVTLVSISKDATSSGLFESTETSQRLTSNAVSTTAPFSGSTMSFAPSYTPSVPGPDFTSTTPGSSNVEASTTSLHSFELTTPSNSALDQRSSQTSSATLSSLSQVTTLEPTTSSTVVEVTFTTRSFTEARSSSSIVAATSSNPESAAVSSMSGPAPSTEGPSRSVSSTSTSVGVASDGQSDPMPTSTSGAVSKVTSIKPGASIMPTFPSSALAQETSSEVVSTTMLTPHPSTAATTLIELQPSSTISPSSGVVDLSTSSHTGSIAPSSASTLTLSSTTTLSLASNSMETFMSHPLESITVIAPSSSELSTGTQMTTSSNAASSIRVSSAFASPATSSVDAVTSTVETLPVPSPSFSSASTAPRSSLADLSIITIDLTSTISSQPTDTIASLSSVLPASSSQIEQVTTVSETSSLPSSTTASQSLPSLPALTTSTQSISSLVPTSVAEPATTQTPQSASGVGTFVTSSVQATVTVSSASSLGTSILTPSPTAVNSGASGSSSVETASSGYSSTAECSSASFGTSILPSTTAARETTSSLLQSETLATSSASPAVPFSESSIDVSKMSTYTATTPVTIAPTDPASSGRSSATITWGQSSSGLYLAPESRSTHSEIPAVATSGLLSSSLVSSSSGSLSTPSSLSDLGQTVPSQHPTSFASTSTTSFASAAIPTSETAGPSSTSENLTSTYASPTITSSNRVSSFYASETLTRLSNTDTSLPSLTSNGTQTTSIAPAASGTITTTFSTVYIFSVQSPALNFSTVAFSLLSYLTGAAVVSTESWASAAVTATTISKSSGRHVPASETLISSKSGLGTNSTWTSSQQPSLTATASIPSSANSTRTRTAELGITFSRSSVPTGTVGIPSPASNATLAETLETSSAPVVPNSTTVSLLASTITESVSGTQSKSESTTSTYISDEASSTSGASGGEPQTSATDSAPTSTPSQTTSAGSPPPLTTSQTAGVAVGATTGLLIAVVAAVFIARRYHATKHGKRASTGSIYPKVAYLYDPKSGGDSGDVEALMSSAVGDPSGPMLGAARAVSFHTQRHSTGTMSVARFTSPGNPFRETFRDPVIHRYSEYVRVDTARALSAAVAGYGGTPDHSSSYTKYPSEVTNPFSDHVIPSPTFAPFSPDDIRRPELKIPRNADNGRGEYSQMAENPYAYLNTPASMYPPVSPYGHLSTQDPSSANDTRRQTLDSDPFVDPFEHDLLLHVDEQNRTSDSVTIFAPSPNLKTPRTPRTPVGPKLPVRQPNGVTSARSLLSPVAAKYLHKAHEVKIPRKSVASPVLVQVGRSPVIKPFSPPPAAPEPLGWDAIKRSSRRSSKHFSDEQSVPAPLNFASHTAGGIIKKKPVPASHIRMKPSLTGAGHTLLAGIGLPLTVRIPHRYGKSVGLDVPKMHGRRDPAHEEVSSDPVVREKRSRELRFAHPALIGKDF